MLVDYTGTLLLVSHDRTFLDNVVTQTIAAEGDGRWGEYVGGYSDWLRQHPPRSPAGASSSRPVTAPSAPAVVATPKRKLSFKEQRELEALPAEIEKLEAEQRALTDKMCAPNYHQTSPDEMRHDSERVVELEALVSQRMDRWVSLEEKA
jgi:ATP-binding cassette subfamily F protein uup